MIEFTEWQIFLICAIIGFVIALGIKYATTNKTWENKREVTSAVISNGILGAILGVVMCAIAYLVGTSITTDYIQVFAWILVTVASGESLNKLLENNIGKVIRIWLGLASKEEKKEIKEDIEGAPEQANEILKSATQEELPDEIEIPINSEQKPEPPIQEEMLIPDGLSDQIPSTRRTGDSPLNSPEATSTGDKIETI
jgi:hypothetical protein